VHGAFAGAMVNLPPSLAHLMKPTGRKEGSGCPRMLPTVLEYDMISLAGLDIQTAPTIGFESTAPGRQRRPQVNCVQMCAGRQRR